MDIIRSFLTNQDREVILYDQILGTLHVVGQCYRLDCFNIATVLLRSDPIHRDSKRKSPGCWQRLLAASLNSRTSLFPYNCFLPLLFSQPCNKPSWRRLTLLLGIVSILYLHCPLLCTFFFFLNNKALGRLQIMMGKATACKRQNEFKIVLKVLHEKL